MKSENRVSFTVRLNLNNPRHREAWDHLRNSSVSYTATIVNALNAQSGSSSPFSDAETLKAIVRQAVAEALSALPVQPVSTSSESSGKEEISDEDFDVADDFMSALGC